MKTLQNYNNAFYFEVEEGRARGRSVLISTRLQVLVLPFLVTDTVQIPLKNIKDAKEKC